MYPARVVPTRIPLLSLLGLLFMLCASAHQAIGQQKTQAKPNAAAQPRPISLPHLYWHFLIQQSNLDAAAAQLQAKDKDGNALRNDLQTRLGFSDADYAPIRASSQRLASELAPLSQQLKDLQRSPSNAAQAQALIAQRETYIANEIYNLSIELSPQNKAALESFMTQFFAPKRITFHAAPPAGQPAGQAVHQ